MSGALSTNNPLHSKYEITCIHSFYYIYTYTTLKKNTITYVPIHVSN